MNCSKNPLFRTHTRRTLSDFHQNWLRSSSYHAGRKLWNWSLVKLFLNNMQTNSTKSTQKEWGYICNGLAYGPLSHFLYLVSEAVFRHFRPHRNTVRTNGRILFFLSFTHVTAAYLTAFILNNDTLPQFSRFPDNTDEMCGMN